MFNSGTFPGWATDAVALSKFDFASLGVVSLGIRKLHALESSNLFLQHCDFFVLLNHLTSVVVRLHFHLLLQGLNLLSDFSLPGHLHFSLERLKLLLMSSSLIRAFSLDFFNEVLKLLVLLDQRVDLCHELFKFSVSRLH